MRKFYFLFIFIGCFYSTLAKEITFNFNVPVGKIEYFKSEDTNTQAQEFFNGSTTLNLEEKEYYFLFSAEGYPSIQKNLDIKNSSAVDNIIFNQENSVTVKGNIKNRDAKLGGVKISFTDVNNHSYNFISDLYGNYTAYLPPGNYKVSAERSGYTQNSGLGIIYEFTKRTTPYSLNFELTELPSYVQGHVVDSEGLPIPFPTISIKNGSKIIKLTGDKLGFFKLPVDSGIITILCQKKGYIQNGTVRKIEKNSFTSNIEIALKRSAYSITGVVTDSTKALRGIKLQLLGQDYKKIATTTTSENGFFEFYKIPGDRKVFIVITVDNKIIKKTDLIDLDKDIKNFNILLDFEEL